MKKWFWLQLFAEGEGGDGATGAEGVDAGHQRLLELGVPEEKLRKRAKRVSEGVVRTTPEETQQVAPAEPTEEEKPVKPSFKELLENDPEYNQQMQSIVQGRLKSAKVAEENLGTLAPVLEILSRKYGVGANDYKGLAKAVSDDDANYEDIALQKGVSVEAAKRIDQEERETARQEKAKKEEMANAQIREHFANLEQQAEQMRQTFPSFNLREALRDERFAKLTHPDVGLSVEDAYYATHHKDIMQAGMQVTAQKTAEQVTDMVRSNMRRPIENGTTGRAPSVTSFDYSKASKAQREALKREISAAAARGEKIYPGR